MSEFTPTDRTQVKRLPKRGQYDREAVYKILETAGRFKESGDGRWTAEEIAEQFSELSRA